MTRVRVDPGICQGYGQCNSLLPTLFEIDDDGTARVLAPEVPTELLGEAAAAADRCPTGAISLADAGTGD
ncbi:MAG TPA: ferredoxin [Trebonia sp.]